MTWKTSARRGACSRQVQVCIKLACPHKKPIPSSPFTDTESIGSSTTELAKTQPKVNTDPEDVKMAGFSCDTFLPCDPRRWMHRFLMVFLMCSLSFGSYYVYDNPAALQRTFTNVRMWELALQLFLCVGSIFIHSYDSNCLSVFTSKAFFLTESMMACLLHLLCVVIVFCVSLVKTLLHCYLMGE